MQTPPRLPFGELTETPTPPAAPGAALQHRPTVIVQQFSLKSRRAQPYPCGVVPLTPGDRCLKPPKGIASQLPSAFVKLCSCSWQGTLRVDRPRLCERTTAEHDEYFLLDKMCWQFAAERWGDAGMARPVAGAACLQELEVHFILEPLEKIVVGYVAFRRGTGPAADATTSLSDTRQGLAPLADTNARSGYLVGSDAEVSDDVYSDAAPLAQEVPTLVQIYVVPDSRRQGLAVAALGVLLAGRNAVIVEMATPAVAKQLLRLGFTQSARRRRRLGAGATGDDQGINRVLYQRRELIIGACDENMENMG